MPSICNAFISVVLLVSSGDGALDLSRVQTVAQANDYFGTAEEHHWVGEVVINDAPVPLELHCLDAGYTDYDIEQQRWKLLGRAQVAGVLMVGDKAIHVLGVRNYRALLLVDLDLLIEPDRIDDDWDALLHHLREVNATGGMGVEDQVTVAFATPERMRIEAALTKSNAHELGNPKRTIALQSAAVEGASTGSTIRTWVGQFSQSDGDVIHNRVLTMRAESRGGGEPATVAMWTLRRADRYVDGAVAEGCPWPTRAAFVRTLQDLYDAHINWLIGEYDEKAQRIVQMDRGVLMTKEEFFAHIDATFGTPEAASWACCRLPEVWHRGLVLLDSADEPRLIGTFFADKYERRRTRINGIISRLTPPDDNPQSCEISCTVRYLMPGNESGGGEYKVSLRRLAP